MTAIRYRTQQVGNVEVFYREAGPADAPVILLLHGFPTSSHMFRDLIPALADSYRVIAPDLPGFGLTKAPPRAQFDYTFDALGDVIDGFVDAIGLQRYAIYIFDYGAPTGLRLALKHPERVTAIITQNGNAYEEGFSKEWESWQTYWREPTPEHREATRAALTDEGNPVPARARLAGGFGLTRRIFARHLLHAPAGGAGNPARPDPQLSDQCRALSGVPGLSSQASATGARGMGEA